MTSPKQGRSPSTQQPANPLCDVESYVREWWKKYGSTQRSFFEDLSAVIDEFRVNLRKALQQGKDALPTATVEAELDYHLRQLPPGGSGSRRREPESEAEAEIYARERVIRCLRAELDDRQRSSTPQGGHSPEPRPTPSASLSGLPEKGKVSQLRPAPATVKQAPKTGPNVAARRAIVRANLELEGLGIRGLFDAEKIKLPRGADWELYRSQHAPWTKAYQQGGEKLRRRIRVIISKDKKA